MSNMNKQLHWTQRIALIRHNLHCASRSGDFGFFKSLQAAGLMEGSNHAATLSATLGDDADTVLSALDNLNAGLAYIHQDAFENVYKSLKSSRRSHDSVMEPEVDKCKIYVDTTMQKNMADMAIDKTTNSATALINQQPAHVQEEATNVWITGVTIITDCMEVALQQMDSLESKLDDFIRLEDSWNTVKTSTACTVSAMKGVFTLMGDSVQDEPRSARASTASIASATGAMFRRMSTAFSQNGSNPGSMSAPSSRTSSISSVGAMPVYKTPQYFRGSISAGCPTSIPERPIFFQHHKLSMVPPTPQDDEPTDPFDNSVPLPPAVVEAPKIPSRFATSGMHSGFEHPLRISQVAS